MVITMYDAVSACAWISDENIICLWYKRTKYVRQSICITYISINAETSKAASFMIWVVVYVNVQLYNLNRCIHRHKWLCMTASPRLAVFDVRRLETSECGDYFNNWSRVWMNKYLYVRSIEHTVVWLYQSKVWIVDFVWHEFPTPTALRGRYYQSAITF
jgi:hypothetical protein